MLPVAFIGPTAAGYIFDAYGSYFRAGFLTGIPFFAAQIFLFRMRLILRAEKKAAISSVKVAPFFRFRGLRSEMIARPST